MKDKYDMIAIVRERLRVFLQNNLGQVEYLRTDVTDRDWVEAGKPTETHIFVKYGQQKISFIGAIEQVGDKLHLPLYNPEIYAKVRAPDRICGNGRNEVWVGDMIEPTDKTFDRRIDALIEKHLGDDLRKMFVAVNPDWKPPTNE